jgi:large subunit ribosomal protein L25
MSETLLAETGRATGSADARRMRRDDLIPAVVYGQGMEPISVSVARRDLRQALSGPAGMNTVLDLSVDGTVYPAIVKELQRHPVRRTVQHIDFLQINLDEEIVVSVPVRLEGEAKEVLQENGLVDLTMNELEVRTTPGSIPDEIVIDVTDMTMDTVITIGDIPLPAGVAATHDDDAPVVTVLTMRTPVLDAEAEAAEAEAEAAEGAEGTEGEAEGGETEGADTAEAAGDDAGE